MESFAEVFRMLVPFADCMSLLKHFNIPVKGILHVGAFLCDEKPVYNEYGIDDSKIVWVEGNHLLVELLHKNKYTNVYHALINDVEEDTKLYVSNNYVSSSLLDFGTHRQYYPDIEFTSYVPGRSITLAHFIENSKIDIENLNFWNFDIQGVELRALKSAGEYLKYADALLLEVNYEEVYKSCDLFTTIDAFLLEKGFVRFDTKFNHPAAWGEAIYIRYPRLST